MGYQQTVNAYNSAYPVDRAEERRKIIEECAKVCEAYSAEIDSQNKRNRVVAAAMTGALSCAAAIRALAGGK